MGLIIAEISAVLIVVAILVFFAWDDYKTGKKRKQEDLEAQRKAEQQEQGSSSE